MDESKCEGRQDRFMHVNSLVDGVVLFRLATQRQPKSWNSLEPLVVFHHSRALNRDILDVARDGCRPTEFEIERITDSPGDRFWGKPTQEATG